MIKRMNGSGIVFIYTLINRSIILGWKKSTFIHLIQSMNLNIGKKMTFQIYIMKNRKRVSALFFRQIIF